jgi:hypothetical protein
VADLTLCVYSNTTYTVTVTIDTKVIKLKLLGNIYEEFHLNEKTVCLQELKGHLSNIIASAALS